jgi:hypothetical protein
MKIYPPTGKGALHHIDNQMLLQSAKKILDKNWTGRFTIPSPVLYPHQWSWDSGFVAIGNSYFCPERAKTELNSLFDAQWHNGMVPHIVFNTHISKKKTTYFPSADFYDVSVSENAPVKAKTSGITQPPVHAMACYYIWKNSGSEELEFLERIYPKVFDFHRYLLTRRDPERSGLVTIFHPWESGLDNLPVWDKPLSRIRIPSGSMPEFKRLDIVAVHGAKDTRTDNETYGKLIYLVQLMKEKYCYDEGRMSREFPFRVKDIVFSSILYVANCYLLEIARALKRQRDISVIKQWISRAEQNFFRYFTPTKSLQRIEADDLYDYDLVQGDWIRKRTIESLVPIYTQIIPKERIEVLVRWINHAHYCGAGNCHVPALPSTDLHESYFRPKNYWRGPVWVNINWMIYWGLQHYGFSERAEQIRQAIFELASNHGFREYYNPFTGRGLGGQDFSWTAALTIDLIMNMNTQTGLAQADRAEGHKDTDKDKGTEKSERRAGSTLAD